MTKEKPSVHALMGLPFHAVSQSEAIEQLWQAVRAEQPLFLTTPNLNFAVACRSDASFRHSVLQSDLVVADGMPLVWAARLLGIPIRERVAGSSVFESIRTSPPPDSGPQMRVFFFGGQPGVARLAHERVNAGSPGMFSAGFLDPGFGSVEQMSSDAVIDAINSACPDFLVVALGAAKGQAWIQRNRNRLNAKVISHLGAVINFSAGSVARAPVWMQNVGLEWLWRIREEPQLWRRYAADALALLSILMKELIPLWFYKRFRPPAIEFRRAQIKVSSSALATRVVLSGPWGKENIKKLETILNSVGCCKGKLILDFKSCTYLDHACLGRFLIMRGQCGESLEFQDVSESLRRQFLRHGVGFLLDGAAPQGSM